MFRFWKLKFEVSEEAKSFISDFLLGLNSVGVAEDILEDRGIIEVSAYFPKEMDLNPVIGSLRNYTSFLEKNLPGIRVGNTTVEEIDRSSWEVWKQELKTVRASRRVVIRPPWEEYVPKDGEIVIEINPSMAFGTGHHETTRLCIQSIEEIIQNARVKNVLDVGCGSGILAISAVKLGAGEAIGLDTDPIAINEATKNLKRNSVPHKVRLFCGYIESVKGKFDLIVVNISAEVIFLIREQVKSRLKKAGKLIVSGVPYSRRDEVVRGLKDVGLIPDKELRDGEWVALLFDVDKNLI
ncbi:MAG: 50S ribosomal protein L11 methyltransferase [Deltaproteobacteria bacterium]|nr:50S ribosomal protein L11 methyltransferase [Deltaproteobacteria bacterium]